MISDGKEKLLEKIYADISTTFTDEDINRIYNMVYNDIYTKVLNKIKNGDVVTKDLSYQIFEKSFLNEPVKEETKIEEPIVKEQVVNDESKMEEINNSYTEETYLLLLNKHEKLKKSGMITQDSIAGMVKDQWSEEKAEAYFEAMEERIEENDKGNI